MRSNTKFKLPAYLITALRDSADSEGIALELLIILLIRAGLDHHGSRR